MKIAVALVGTVVILAAGSAFAAQVTNVGLTWQDGYTVARVDVQQGAVRFSHQAEAAKDGRPFRVIVDVLSATHQLGQKEFFELPSCPVTKIRTSQYAVQPEQVVRLVFDMTHETVYKINSDETGITVQFPDPDGAQFAGWSSKSWLAAKAQTPAPVVAQAPAESRPTMPPPPSRKPATQLNQSINDDRMASLANAGSVPSGTATAPVQTPKPEAKATSSPVTPVKESRPQSATPPALADGSKPSAAAKPSETPKAEAGSAPSKPALPAVAKPDTISADIPKKPDIKPEPPAPMRMSDADQVPPTPSPKPAPVTLSPTLPQAGKPIPSTAVAVTSAAKTPSGQTTPPTAANPAPEAAKAPSTTVQPAEEGTAPAEEEVPEPEDLEPAVEPSQDVQPQDESSNRSTARFRRSPTDPTKIKGTLVAQFPTRLVIKYEPGGRRDPFMTLIDETKQYNNPVERRIPNVEGLRLVGVLQSPLGNSALFEDKDGYGYILREGDKIQKGYVLRIQTDRVFFQIFEYGWSRTVALNLESEY